MEPALSQMDLGRDKGFVIINPCVCELLCYFIPMTYSLNKVSAVKKLEISYSKGVSHAKPATNRRDSQVVKYTSHNLQVLILSLCTRHP
jgi:hypothetical protein